MTPPRVTDADAWRENVERVREALLDTLASGVPAASIDPFALDALAALTAQMEEMDRRIERLERIEDAACGIEATFGLGYEFTGTPRYRSLHKLRCVLATDEAGNE